MSASFQPRRTLPPDEPQSLLGEELGPHPAEVLDRQCQPLWERKTLVVLHGPETHAAAVDLESKFSEAALGDVQLADFRNFAHGRHHWLAKRGGESGVLAMLTNEDRQLGEALLELLPAAVPVVRLAAPGQDTVAALAALAQVFMVAGMPGEPEASTPATPAFPRSGGRFTTCPPSGPPRSVTARRPLPWRRPSSGRAGRVSPRLSPKGHFPGGSPRMPTSSGQLNAATFRGIILDYDGTLCDEAHRFDALPDGRWPEVELRASCRCRRRARDGPR